MLATSKFTKDNSNSPNLFCYKQPSQTIRAQDCSNNANSKTDLISKKKTKLSQDIKKHNPEDELTLTPGPAAYNPENAVKAVYRSIPSIFFTGRYSYSRTDPTPGPYYNPQITRFSDKLSPSGSLAHPFGKRHSWYKAPFIVKYK